ncbi:DUF4942 domain-containing protein [uncultured Rhodoferax sp.]|uniref:DUF4942 domain-containing protein n=1 Tax=uncultured Rhodoferax sp. TaxID=223188 RepID=UPI0025FB27A7|nr:DUF4942 domain-containing protein [uncultured Rhodoferax sp.]
MRKRIEALAEHVSGENMAAMEYFLDGNKDPHGNGRYTVAARYLFDVKGAVASLNSAYWSKTLALTDVLNLMPQKRRDEWNKTIREMTAPDFTDESVRPTITELLNMRAQFLAERVDGIFRGLSGEHVTNAPEGFGKRMIIARVLSAYDTTDHSTCGLINDLRCVVAKFMGRTEPGWSATSDLIPILKRNWGQWVTIDGGAMKIRLYKKGTAHMEVHPDMAWRLNSVLANLYPLAIPAQFRQKPARKVKDFLMMARPLPFPVLSLLAGLRAATERISGWPERYRTLENTYRFDNLSTAKDSPAAAEAIRVLKAIGATVCANGWHFAFDYHPREVLDQIIASGCIPDQKAHQFYPTPESLARVAVDLADIGESHTVLEPSAGMGGLADLLPKERTECVEISALHCKVLESKGFRTQKADFLGWKAGSFNRIVMNPPFSEGRWQAHTLHAAGMLRDKGVLVAILPASARKSFTVPGLQCEWHGPYDNEFAGTSVSVVILKAVRA